MDEKNLNTENSYRSVGNFQNESGSFSKSVILPLVSGIVGATLTLGVCFNIPQIRGKIIGNISPVTAVSNSNSSIDSYSSSNNLVSLSNFSDTSVSVASKVLPSVVGIKVEYNVNSLFFSQQSTASAEGSGVIISHDGYILTNNHIVNTSSSYYEVSEASKVTVYLYGDETEYEATIIGTDEQTDLAVIKIDKSDLTPAELGNSDSIKIGEFAMAVGNPLGMQNSVSSGIISAIDREITDTDGKKFTLIQTDTAINSGNSGGALVNSSGQVIGINTMKLAGTGIEGMGFAIPINDTKPIYEDLIQYNKVKRPYIGFSGIDLDEKTAKANNLVIGVYVKSIDDFSAAEKAGLKPGDVVIKINNTPITTMDELNNIKNQHEIGDEIVLTVVRNEKEREINVVLMEQP